MAPGLVLVVLSLMVVSCQAMVREYFIAAVEENWDYAPDGRIHISPDQRSKADAYLKQEPDRIGKVYTKVLYHQYTDATFTKRKIQPAWLGFLGPILKGEVGDSILVHFLNNASLPFSVHPHGLFYNKRNEGAVYSDGTTGADKQDDIIVAGSRVQYLWNVTTNMAPEEMDAVCIPWVYHSHVVPPKDTNTGLIGVLITCKKGSLTAAGNRHDVDHEIALVLKAYDENMSWMIENNLRKCGQPSLCSHLLDQEDAKFYESNVMHAINGYVYGTLPGLIANEGDRVAWYIIGMGNEIDIHNIYFSGQTIHFLHRRGDTVPAYAASFLSTVMTVGAPGNWTVSCMVSDHLEGGMEAIFQVKPNSKRHVSTAPAGVHRPYYLTIVEEEWDYGPGGVDRYNGQPLTTLGSQCATFFTKENNRIGGRYKKARFVPYNDTALSQSLATSNGILGPPMRAELGDMVSVLLGNLASRNYSINLHGVTVADTSVIQGGVAPGGYRRFDFHVPENLLGPNDPNCIVELYTSTVDRVRDVSSGLVGPFVICKKGVLAHSLPQNEKEFFLLFSTFDENKSWYLNDNIKTYCSDPTNVNKDDPDFQASNIMSGINGRMYGTLEGLNMCFHDKVRWHLMSLGSEKDIHGAYFHGNTFSTAAGETRDRLDLIPGSTASVVMVPDNPGCWAILSETHSMQRHGVEALYNISVCSNQVTMPSITGVVRRYHIAAEEVEWDFAKPSENVSSIANKTFVGTTYKKAVFREYRDAAFRMPRVRDAETIHLDILGPLLKAEVGDVIEVIFRNKASRSYSIHPHGLQYDKVNEGANYAGQKEGIPPGATHTYRWYVPERSGPGKSDPNCLPWLYYSDADSIRDAMSGLVGTLIVCKKGSVTADGRRKDVNREFALLFAVFDENLSWYIEENIKNHAPGRVNTIYKNDHSFKESNKMFAINGKIFVNNQGLVMNVNETVVWYLLSIGSDIDIHTVHLHGHTYKESMEFKRRNDVTAMFPGNAKAVEMFADNPGTWLLHCHVLGHIVGGMETVYTVTASASGVPVG